MVVIAADMDNQHTGLALVAGAPGAEQVLDVARVVMGPDPFAGAVGRVAPIAARWLDAHPGARLVIERPPPMVRSDVHHGPQAAIGDALGWVSGALAGALSGRLTAPPCRVSSSDWRAVLAPVAARHGVSLPTSPGQARPAGGRPELVRAPDLRLRFGCGHEVPFNPARAASAPASCPTCAGRRADPAEARRDWHKQRAWMVAEAVAPALMARVLEEAKATARSEREPWRMAGVDDVADAVCLGLHGLNTKLDTRPSGTGVGCA
jgi:hypothetical protein